MPFGPELPQAVRLLLAAGRRRQPPPQPSSGIQFHHGQNTMNPTTRKWIQLALLLAIALAAARMIWLLSQRRPGEEAHGGGQAGSKPLAAEYYVVPKKLYAHDLKSAGQLTQQPEWVKEGYRYTYYPYDPATRRVNFKSEAGTLGPIERLDITSMIAQPSPGAPGQKQVMAVFQKDSRSFAVPVGFEAGGDYTIYADEMFFYQDPHQLYNFWPKPVWDAIAAHQVTKGMNEIQASFAVGVGVPSPSNGDEKTVKYPNGGSPLVVTYENGRATEIHSGRS